MRTFIAVDASAAEITRLQNEIMSTAGWSINEVKPVETQNFHFTLFFLGEKTNADVESINAKLGQVLFDPFTLTYTSIGAFPKPPSARVVWIGIDPEGGQRLAALANDVVAKMAELGFSADKPFSPHLTIFRARGRPIQISDITTKYQGKTFGSDLIDKLHLKKSDLTASGPVYSNIYTVDSKK